MKFIGFSNIVVLAVGMALDASASAYATDKQPTSVHDPVFGLTYQIATARLEAVAPELFKVCADLVNENASRMSWIFAKLDTTIGVYYILGGYYVRRGTASAIAHKYESDDNGVLARVVGGNCELIDPANGSFGSGSALPADILEPLAADLRTRLEKGLGGRSALRHALRAHKVRLGGLAPAAQRGFGRP